MTAVGAVVVGGDYRGLGIVRSLGRHGVPVWVVHGEDSLARHSRYCGRAIRRVGSEDEHLVTFLMDLAERGGLDGWVLFPTSDETAWQFSRHRDLLATRYRMTVPPEDVYATAADKRTAHALATSVGVRTPRTWFPRGRDLASLDISAADLPLVLKPTRREGRNAITVAKGWRVDDKASLRSRYEQASTMLPADAIMIQEWVPGDGAHQYAVGAVCSAGEPRLSVAVRRTRQYPRDFGRASCFVETIDHPMLVRHATRLLRALHMDGLAEVEFKQNERRGDLELLDVNVRVWGWHSIGAAAGVDFAHAAYRLALGEDLPIQRGIAGVRWSRLTIDIPYAAADVARGKARTGAILSSLRPPLEGPVAALDDVLPGIIEAPLLLRMAMRQRSARSPVRASRPPGADQEASCTSLSHRSGVRRASVVGSSPPHSR